MEAKMVSRIVKVNVFVTEDGEEFEHKEDALSHEAKVQFVNLFGDIGEELEENEETFFVVNNIEDTSTIRNYIEEGLGQFCNIKFNPSLVQYPALVCYNSDGDLVLVDNEEYLKHKKICDMYESCRKL